MIAAAIKPKRARKPRRQYGLAEDGTPVVSVTQVLASLGWSKDSLMWWASSCAVDETIRMLSTGMHPDEVAKLARGAHIKKRDAAADAGTAAHAMVEAYLADEDPDDAVDPFLPNEVLTGALCAFNKFGVWWAARYAEGWRVVESERPFIDRKSGVAGTPDLILRAPDGVLVVADVKTGKGVYDEVALQLAAYAMLASAEGYVIPRGLVIHIPIEGEMRAHEVPEPVMHRMALAFGHLVAVHKSRSIIKAQCTFGKEG